MEALNQLARSMAVFPGRKNLIWISGGIPFDPDDTTPQMQKTACTAGGNGDRGVSH